LLNSLEIELIGVDISPTRIAEVKKNIEDTGLKSQKKVSFYECNFDTQFNVLNSDLFDVVIALDIMEHVFDVFGFVDNCYRILKQEGALIIRVPNVAYIKHRVGLFFGNLPITASWFGNQDDLSGWRDHWGWDGGHLHYFTIPLLYQLLKQSGFQIELCRDPGTKFSTFRNLLPELLYSNPLIIAKK
jgi:cyclopropane fatty-acyl-phospholipid synthase-like methyltransferase